MTLTNTHTAGISLFDDGTMWSLDTPWGTVYVNHNVGCDEFPERIEVNVDFNPEEQGVGLDLSCCGSEVWSNGLSEYTPAQQVVLGVFRTLDSGAQDAVLHWFHGHDLEERREAARKETQPGIIRELRTVYGAGFFDLLPAEVLR